MRVRPCADCAAEERDLLTGSKPIKLWGILLAHQKSVKSLGFTFAEMTGMISAAHTEDCLANTARLQNPLKYAVIPRHCFTAPHEMTK